MWPLLLVLLLLQLRLQSMLLQLAMALTCQLVGALLLQQHWSQIAAAETAAVGHAPLWTLKTLQS